VGTEEQVEQSEESVLIRRSLPSEGFGCGYLIPLIKVFPRVIDDLRAFMVGHNPETTRQRCLERLVMSRALPFSGRPLHGFHDHEDSDGCSTP
jgi:hypothetical protein